MSIPDFKNIDLDLSLRPKVDGKEVKTRNTSENIKCKNLYSAKDIEEYKHTNSVSRGYRFLI